MLFVIHQCKGGNLYKKIKKPELCCPLVTACVPALVEDVYDVLTWVHCIVS